VSALRDGQSGGVHRYRCRSCNPSRLAARERQRRSCCARKGAGSSWRRVTGGTTALSTAFDSVLQHCFRFSSSALLSIQFFSTAFDSVLQHCSRLSSSALLSSQFFSTALDSVLQHCSRLSSSAPFAAPPRPGTDLHRGATCSTLYGMQVARVAVTEDQWRAFR